MSNSPLYDYVFCVLLPFFASLRLFCFADSLTWLCLRLLLLLLLPLLVLFYFCCCFCSLACLLFRCVVFIFTLFSAERRHGVVVLVTFVRASVAEYWHEICMNALLEPHVVVCYVFIFVFLFLPIQSPLQFALFSGFLCVRVYVASSCGSCVRRFFLLLLLMLLLLLRFVFRSVRWCAGFDVDVWVANENTNRSIEWP